MDYDKFEEIINGILAGKGIPDSGLQELPPEACGLADSVKKLADKLAETEGKADFLYTAVMKTPVPMVLFDKKLKITDANDEMIVFSGRSKSELTGLDIRGFRKEFNIDKTEGFGTPDALERKEKVEGLFKADFRGRQYSVRIFSTPITDESGAVTHINTSIVDVSEAESITEYLGREIEKIGKNLEKISLGDPDLSLAAGEADEYTGEIKKEIEDINRSIARVRDSVMAVVKEAENIGVALTNGELKHKAEVSDHNGVYRELIEKLNEISSGIREPLVIVNDRIKMIARGEIPDRIDEQFRGEFDILRKNINSSIDGLQAITEVENVLKKMSVNDYTVDISGKYEGIYSNITEEVSLVKMRLLNVQDIAARTSRGDLSRLDELKKIGRRSEKDELLPSLVRMMENINDMIEDVVRLSDNAVMGRIDERADAGAYEGAYKEVIDGINKMLDAVEIPVTEAIRVSGELADGNFGVRVNDKLRMEGEFRVFKEAVNNIGISVSEAINSSTGIAQKVAMNSNEVSKGTDEVAKAAEGVATTSQKTAELTKSLLEQIEDINRQIADLSASNEEIAGTSQEVFTAANHVVEIGKEAQKLGNDANSKMNNVEVIANQSVTEINSLTEQIKEINNVVKLINDITGQINLLALNAAIEAARAGEHGRGFAVVAGEVKNLAAEAREATSSIDKVVSSIGQSSEKTASSIKSANNEIVDGVSSVTKALEALNTIIVNAGRVSGDIGEITKAIEDQANIANNVVTSADRGTHMTKDVQREAEELAALAEEASASVEEISSAIHEVNELSRDLEREMGRFRT
ncbi:methyl-accepting chemotaxis protein [Methanoplanus limicola]|uniref:Methyl-accepting chemotaxis sensory transducer with Pas/Pac sensor n=1 Tax=Methanoplanus limicola DSM 2279 TaxID=937775 RepID=H1YYV3_9EURY|nr:methyl-accepting chemotaxis protein [Methanoplanus limicola]EHQ37025.1 methyl-accepting chemotaxis sensory transducer with Pas/Pac sensor [Methanoplanus limicola DSM 2279]